MSTLTSPRNQVKPIRLATSPAVAPGNPTVAPASPDPWYADRPAYAVAKADLTFAARVRHKVIPGVWKVVRAATRLDSTCRYTIRVREFAADGSLIGPVLNWTLDEVAAIVTDEPKAEPATRSVEEIVPQPIAPPAAKPLTVAMVISIDGTHYAVSPLAPAPDASKAYRFAKVGGDENVYDVEELAGVSRCDCADFVFRREGLDTLGCKHIRAAWMMGLIGESTPAPGGRLVEAVPCCPPSEIAPCTACLDADEPAGKAWDPTVGVEEDEDPRYGPQDDGGGGWDAYDDDRWAVNEPAARSLADQVLAHARELRAVGSPLHDLLAERAEQLAGEIRYLDATTVGQYRDRREAALDAARDAAEARQAARCC